jgi:hypothetical protein
MESSTTIYQGVAIPHLSIASGEQLLFETEHAVSRGCDKKLPLAA